MTTLGYGIIGAFFNYSYIISPLAASIGFGISFYDEVRHKGMNVVKPAAGIIVGGLIGSLFDVNDNQYVPNILTNVGATIGCGLGLYKSYINRNKLVD